jgi:hypothetical protein
VFLRIVWAGGFRPPFRLWLGVGCADLLPRAPAHKPKPSEAGERHGCIVPAPSREGLQRRWHVTGVRSAVSSSRSRSFTSAVAPRRPLSAQRPPVLLVVFFGVIPDDFLVNPMLGMNCGEALLNRP